MTGEKHLVVEYTSAEPEASRQLSTARCSCHMLPDSMLPVFLHRGRVSTLAADPTFLFVSGDQLMFHVHGERIGSAPRFQTKSHGFAKTHAKLVERQLGVYCLEERTWCKAGEQVRTGSGQATAQFNLVKPQTIKTW